MSFPKYCFEVQEANDLYKFNYYDTTPEGSNCPRYAQFFGQMGASCSMFMCGEYQSSSSTMGFRSRAADGISPHGAPQYHLG